MHLKFDEQGYVCCILYGCHTDGCIEYAGIVPTQPEEYEDIDDWADRAQTQAYKLDGNGNLIYDAERAASLPEEDDVEPLPIEYLQKLGIIDAIYPVGSIYMSVNEVSPETLFGGTWEQIEDRFLLASGSTYEAGTLGGKENHEHLAPIGYNTANKFMGITFAIGESTMNVNGDYAFYDNAMMTGSGNANWKLAKTNTENNMPPYLAVFVWKRTA